MHHIPSSTTSSTIMENNRCKHILLITLLVFTTISNLSMVATQETKTYIVQLSSPPDHIEDLESWYKTFLPTVALDSDAKPQMVHTYRHVFRGFAAKLTAEQAAEIEKMDGVISVQPERVLSLQTTHSPNFLGLNKNVGFWEVSNYGKGIIIGVLDGGINPDSDSFDDIGVGPPPAKWKGMCELEGCNNKLIGIRNFVDDVNNSPLDYDGHGTHTSSTAAGNFVEGANTLGSANGTAVGMAPLAHVAMYKVCGVDECPEGSILRGMEAAIEDGVDVLSLSLGQKNVLNFYEENTAKAAFAAIKRGIFVSCSAGNDGPSDGTLSNQAPWILTVGASTIDRKIITRVKLGNGVLLDGESVFQRNNIPQTMLPLVYPGMSGDRGAIFCNETGALDNMDVKGKVVLCNGIFNDGSVVKDAGGAAMILINTKIDGATTIADVRVLPSSHLNYEDGLKVLDYWRSSPSPVATIISGATVIGDKTAPRVASFSSRGPNIASHGILKPDIIGPGVNILAAWYNYPFSVISGTSMACPHLSGIAALLKSTHPDWSPAGIKSAIMTTAYSCNLNNELILDETKDPANLFAIGAGHVNPSKANDPGLIYDIQADDYIPYLCGLGYSDQQVYAVVRETIYCSDVASIPEAQLNYPSFAITLSGDEKQSFTRTVTNVGDAESTYTLKLTTPPEMCVTVSPSTLVFSAVNQKLSYEVTFIPVNSASNTYVEGSLEWNSMKHSVRSPISVIYV